MYVEQLAGMKWNKLKCLHRAGRAFVCFNPKLLRKFQSRIIRLRGALILKQLSKNLCIIWENVRNICFVEFSQISFDKSE